ncbi:nucleoside triphosphate pyrophosphohydrolase [Membranihabitans marinus]|uniref:nucleoside triphosphate pyrophosphohydrolase n=1 Tax=Membranihabitans marinus TaxID=1227546 RepID=UPI001F357D1A|nr:nucleoside triphosphate pyrophosphohydrolase [Membranihabitans marinus]
MTNDTRAIAFLRLLKIMDELREHCPWDRKQTFESLRNLTIEETYELVDAIDSGDMADIEEEVGDVLLHLVFYAKMGSEQESFNISTIINRLCDKLIHRHPHIYGDIKVQDASEVQSNWEQLKLKEGKKSILQGVPKALPALIKAQRLQEKTAQVGFEWTEVKQVMDKVEEEWAELKTELARDIPNSNHIEEEFGDLLFSMVNLARFIDVEPETALERTNAKFKSRFEYIEQNARRPLADMSLEEMDDLWNKAKVILEKE